MQTKKTDFDDVSCKQLSCAFEINGDIKLINNLNIEIFTTIKVNNRKYNIPMFIRIKGERFVKSDLIGKGTYGFVVLYKSHFGNKCAKFPLEKDSIVQDIKIANILNHNILPNILIPYYVYKNSYIVMNMMDGDLKKFIEIYKPDNFYKMNIVYNIITKIYILYKKNLYYTDIKPSNIMYKIYSKKDSSEQYPYFYLGDFGCINDKNGTCQSTHMTPQRCELPEEKKLDNPNKCDLIWGIGCLIMQMWGINPVYTNFKPWSIEDHEKFIIKLIMLIEKVPEYRNVFDLMYIIQNDKIMVNEFCTLKKIVLEFKTCSLSKKEKEMIS